MLKKYAQVLLECFHLTLFCVMLPPFFYMFVTERESQIEIKLYFACFFILIPIIIAKIVSFRSKHILSYVLTYVIVVFAMGMGLKQMGEVCSLGDMTIWYVFWMVFETTIVWIEMFLERLERLKKKRACEEEDISWKERNSILEKPKPVSTIFFIFIYILAQNFESEILCNQAFFSAICYFLLAILYEYIEKTRDYFEKNKDLGQVPYQRIYGISSRIFLVLFVLLGIMTLPSTFLIGERQYRDVRDWMAQSDIDYYEIAQVEEETREKDPIMEMLEQYQENQRQAPKWLNQFFYVMGIFGVGIVFYIMLRSIKITFSDFRQAYGENGDYVEQIERVEKSKKKIERRRKLGKESEREKIRRQYRQWIRLHKKELPDPSQTPYEIEEYANIPKTEERKEMHEKYEKARYQETRE